MKRVFFFGGGGYLKTPLNLQTVKSLDQLGLKENMRIEESRIDEDNAVDFYVYGTSEDDVEVDDEGNNDSEYLKKLKSLYKHLEGYCLELAVFGFNSGEYNLKLIKQYLFRELC